MQIPYIKKTWAVVLAGGDGTRLKQLTRVISGDARPKQFCPIFGGQTLLAQTRARIQPLVARDRTLFVVRTAHKPYYADDLSGVDSSQILAQPANKGTAPAIAFSAVQILMREPDAIVAFLPADHYYDDDAPFLTALESAFEIAGRGEDRLVLLGAEPYCPEVEYGWIEAASDGEPHSFSRVSRFWEKPSLEHAQELFDRGCLWNTFVMVGRAAMFVDVLRANIPGLVEGFESASGPAASHRLRKLYRKIAPADFSRQVLSNCAERLAVVSMGNTRWSDLGKPERVIATLSQAGIRPQWETGLQSKAIA